jgi:hypothetical protein
MAVDEPDAETDDAAPGGDLQLADAEEYVIKQRCEAILDARQQALDLLSNYHTLRQQASNEREDGEIQSSVASTVWQFAYEAKHLLQQTDAGQQVWTDEQLGTWELSTPSVNGDVRRVREYRVKGRGTVRDGPPVIPIVGVREYVDLAPPVTVQAVAEVVPGDRRAPRPETRTVAEQQSPPREILVTVFDAVDGVVSDLGLAPEVKPAREEAAFDYEDLLDNDAPDRD